MRYAGVRLCDINNISCFAGRGCLLVKSFFFSGNYHRARNHGSNRPDETEGVGGNKNTFMRVLIDYGQD